MVIIHLKLKNGLTIIFHKYKIHICVTLCLEIMMRLQKIFKSVMFDAIFFQSK